MRELSAAAVQRAVAGMVIDANCRISPEVLRQLERCRTQEERPLAAGILGRIIENDRLAAEQGVPMCQDTGMAVVFLDVGQDVHLTGGDLTEAVNAGVRRAYRDGCFRNSVLTPLERVNTGDNTPAVLHVRILPGEQVHITVAPKGFGSENMSQIRMFKPSAGLQGIKDFILEVVETAGPNPCPPMVVGVGIGGTFDKCALLAKKALMRPLDTQNPDPFYADLEKEMLEKVNKLGIGPQGFGGKTTAIGLNIETMPTHIAGMPCAVNINCLSLIHI